MSEIEVTAAAAGAILAYSYYNYVNTFLNKKIQKPWRKKRWWMLSIHRNRTRDWMERQCAELVKEPLSGEFENFYRMSPEDFENLLVQIGPLITKQDTQFREAIPPNIRLAITLRFLATGDSYKSLHFLFKVSSQSISKIVPEVCSALNQVLKDECKLPVTAEQWLQLESGFKEKFPHALAAIDGKHIVVRCPPNSGTDYYNYKNSFSIVLLALVDSDYRFIFVDIGAKGRISDGGVFRNCLLWQKIIAQDLCLPDPRPLPGTEGPCLPYVFLGDGAFALGVNLMKPYPGNHEKDSPNRIFNYKLSSGRVYVENVFGILASKFRVFNKPLEIDITTVPNVVKTCVLLHNFLRRSVTSKNIYTPPGATDIYDDNGLLVQSGSWRQAIGENCAIRSFPTLGRRASTSCIKIRDSFRDYFNSKNNF